MTSRQVSKLAFRKNAIKEKLGIIKREVATDKLALASITILTIILLCVFITTTIIDQQDAMRLNWLPGAFNQRPSFRHILGTDYRGRDGFVILMFATRNSLSIVLLVTVISSTIGIAYGMIAGYFGGRIDSFMMRIVEALSILPTLALLVLFLGLFMVGIVDDVPVSTFVTIMSLLSWLQVAKVVRSNVLQEKEQEYVESSRTVGSSSLQIMTNQILPNISNMVVAAVVLNIVGIIGMETALSFLNLSFHTDNPSLGVLMSTARAFRFIRHRWWAWVPSAVMVVLLIFSINNIGNMLNRASDARARRG